MRHMIPLLGLCGVSTFIMGALTGGFFGDFLTQVVKLTTGGDFDYFIAPIAIRQELTDQQLIRPFPATGEFFLPLNDEYALYLAHSADEDAAVSPPEF